MSGTCITVVNQAPGELFEQFVIDLKIKAKSCGFYTQG